jgi:O-antigen/teichoic acid export membrane protein
MAYSLRPVKWRWDMAMNKSLLKTGSPLFLAAILSLLCLSIDRWVLVSWVRPEQLGYYAFLISLAGNLLFIPRSIDIVYYNRLLIETTIPLKDLNYFRQMVLQPAGRVQFIIASIGLLLADMFMPLVLPFVFPQYIPSLPLSFLILMSYAQWSTSHHFQLFLTSQNMRKPLILIPLLAIASMFIASQCLFYFAGTLNGFLVLFFTFSSLVLITYTFSALTHFPLTRARRLRLSLSPALPTILAVLVHESAETLGAIAQCLISLVVLIAVANSLSGINPLVDMKGLIKKLQWGRGF